jgi:hypothetical protein
MHNKFSIKLATILTIFAFIFTGYGFNLSINISAKNNEQNISIQSEVKKSDTKPSKLKKSEFKIKDGEIDNQFDVNMTKDEEKAFKLCKQQEKKDRKPKYRNRPTACLKKPSKVSDEATNQDYNLLWQYVNKQLEESSGVDMSIELPLTEFIESAESSNITSSVDTNSSQVISQSSKTSSLSSESTTSSSSSISNDLSPAQSSDPNITVLSSSSTSIFESQSSSKVSWIDSILSFGSIKTEAAVNDGFRLPYENTKKQL